MGRNLGDHVGEGTPGRGSRTVEPGLCYLWVRADATVLPTVPLALWAANLFSKTKQGIGGRGWGRGGGKILFIISNFSRIWLEKISTFYIFLKVLCCCLFV